MNDSGDHLTRAEEAELAQAKPQKHNAFKVELAQRTIAQALTTVAEMT